MLLVIAICYTVSPYKSERSSKEQMGPQSITVSCEQGRAGELLPVNLQNNRAEDENKKSAAGDQRGGVSIQGVSKRFRKQTVARKSYSTVKSTLLGKIFRRAGAGERYLTALHKLSIDVPPGSSLGLIGKNGSGKSTLLKLIAGIYRPDSGKITVNGRISALIELGAGFHPDFTGRENIYLGGVMFGLTRKEIDRRFDQIVEYSELGDFIDDPVRTYSSGMYMRLGFSLAVHTDPDILLIDEVLAVGDAGFISRCHDTISEFKRRGKTLIFVTHDLPSVLRWCEEAIWLDKGSVVCRGEPRWVIDSYLTEIEQEHERRLVEANQPEPAESEPPVEIEEAVNEPEAVEQHRWGSKGVEITAVRLKDSTGSERWVLKGGESCTVEVDYQINEPIDDLVFGVGVLRADGLAVHATNTAIENVEVPLPAGSNLPIQGTYRYRIEQLPLVEDTYFLDVAAHKEDGFPYDYHHRMYKFSMRNEFKQQGVFNPTHSWEFEPKYQVKARVKEEKQGVS